MIELDMKALQVLWAFGGDARDQLLWCDALCFGLEHDGRAMRIVCTDKMHGMSSHAHGTHPDVRLDVFHDVADVKRAIGIGECGRDKYSSGHVRYAA